MLEKFEDTKGVLIIKWKVIIPQALVTLVEFSCSI